MAGRLRTPRPGWGWLAASLVLVAAVAGLGQAAGSGDSDWYRSLDRAPWDPPGYAFAIVWPVLYVLMAVAVWLFVRSSVDRALSRRGVTLYLVQLALNLAWTWIFFAGHRPGLALVDILVLTAAVVLTAAAFAGASTRAAVLLLPYLAWLAFAVSLNAWIVLQN